MLEKLRKQREAAINRMRALVDLAAKEDRDMTAEEQAEFDACEKKANDLKPKIAQLEQLETAEAELDAPAPTAAAHRQHPGAAPGPAAKKEFESLGHFLHAVRFNPSDQRLNFKEGVDREAAMEMGTGASGGFAVPTQFREQLLSVSPQEALVRPRATVIPAGSPPDAAITMPALDQSGTTGPANMYGGVTVTWIAEGGTKPETDMDLREITLQPREVAGHMVVTDKLLRNWMAASSVIEAQFRGAITGAEDYAFIRGDGAGKPLGYINSAAAYGVTRTTSSQFKLPDVQNMLARLLMRGGSPLWVMSQSVMPQLLTMRNYAGTSPEQGDGALVYHPQVAPGQLPTLMGYPIFWSERAPALGSLGDVSLVDLSNYLVKDGSGIFVSASEHVHFTTNKTVIKAFWNVDGQPWLSSTLNLENDYDVSPFVVLNA